MRLRYAIPVRGIEALADGSHALLGVETNMAYVPGVPAPIAARFFVGFEAPFHEAQDGAPKSKLCARVIDPDMDPVGEPLEVEFNITPGPNSPAGWSVRAQAPVLLQFVAPMIGVYTVDFDLDGDRLEVPLIIAEPPQPPPE